MIRRAFQALLLMAASAAASTVAAPTAGGAETTAQRQVLVMLRMPPLHYRPGAGYVGGYGDLQGHGARHRTAVALARGHGLTLHDEWPMPALGVDCFVLDAPDPGRAQREAQALAADPRVESAQPMQLFHVLGSGPRPPLDPLYAAQPATLAWHLTELHAQVTGKGVRVAIVDSGVALDHPDLLGQVALSHNFVDAGPAPGEAHGTAVAGIIAAREGNGLGLVGIAPQARLLALRACWQVDAASASCSSFTLARALQFAIDARAQVLNLSLSGPDDRLLARLLDVALRRGISVVGAYDAGQRDGGFPASHPGVLAVDGIGHAGFALALHAPDEGIPTTLANGGWGLVSGASFAAAQVSGLVALLREERPQLRPAQLLTLLEPAAGLRSPPEPPRAIDACAVMQRTAGHCVCTCVTASAAR